LTIQRKRVAKRLASGLLAGALALGGLAISGGGVSAKTPTTTATRVQGTDRYSTSVALANKYIAANSSWKPNANLILASGENFPDALAASALAKVTNAPIILTKSNALPASVRDWLLTKQGDFTASVMGKVYVVGGAAAVSEDVVTAVLSTINTAADLTPHTAVRLAGDNRYETAAAINAVTGLVTTGDAMIIVDGTKFADAVSAAPLAYAGGWPIVPVTGGAIDANGVATFTAFATAQGGAANAKVLIMGGTSAVPKSVEEQLAVAGVNIRNITRIQGADRYATSLALNAQIWDNNVYGGGGYNSVSFDASGIALVSGENFPDAIAAGPWLGHAKIHLQLTNGSGLNPSAEGLLKTVAKRDDASAGNPATLYAVGGESAVSASNITSGVAAAQSVNFTFTSMTCFESDGVSNIDLNFAPGLASYAPQDEGFSAAEKSAILGAFSQDGSALSNIVAGAEPKFGDADLDGVKDRIRVTVSSLSVPAFSASTIQFAGVTEPTGGKGRSFGTASCTIVDDAVAPQVTLTGTQKTGGSAPTKLYLRGSEKLDCAELDVTKVHVGATIGASGTATASALALSSQICEITLNSVAFGGIGATTTVAALVDVVEDLAGNDTVARYDGAIALDNGKPSIASASITCTAKASPAVEVFSSGVNGITVSAKSYLYGGTKDGVVGNNYKVSVVSQRGMLIPSLVVDDTAKTIVVTADTAYHTGADVKQAVANAGGNSDWAVTASGDGTLAATLTPLLMGATTLGTQDCTMEIVTNEFVSAVSVTSITANGLTVASGGGNLQYATPAVGTLGNNGYISIDLDPGTVIATGSVSFAGTITDIAGNAGVVATVI